MRSLGLYCAVLLLLMGFVYAAELNTSLSVGGTGQYTNTAQDSATVQGGNVTEMNLTSYATTIQWVGFYGNVSTSLRLGDGSAILFDFGSANPLAVFASTGNNIDFTSLNPLDSGAEKTAYDADFSFTISDSDSISNAFDSVAACDAGTLITNSYSVTPNNSSSQPGAWDVCAAQDAGAGLDDTLFGTNLISSGADAFNGEYVQYQLMLPVSGGNDVYYFYLEI